jgi:hypothetical protein
MSERALIGFRSAPNEPYRATYVHNFYPDHSGALMVARLIALYEGNVEALRDEVLRTGWSVYPERAYNELDERLCADLDEMQESQGDTDWLVTWDAGTVTFWKMTPLSDDAPTPWLTLDTTADAMVQASGLAEMQRGAQFLENVSGYIDGKVMERIWDGWEDAFEAARSQARVSSSPTLTTESKEPQCQSN